MPHIADYFGKLLPWQQDSNIELITLIRSSETMFNRRLLFNGARGGSDPPTTLEFDIDQPDGSRLPGAKITITAKLLRKPRITRAWPYSTKSRRI